MTEVKKASKKLIVTVLSCAAVFAVLIILATCSLFDEQSVTVPTTDWKTIVKNSHWVFSEKNVTDSNKLIPALQTITSVDFGEDYAVSIKYLDGSNELTYGGNTLSFSTDSTGTLSLRQATGSGSVTNNVTFVFSNQSESTFNNKNLVMTFKVEGIGSLYFFSE